MPVVSIEVHPQPPDDTDLAFDPDLTTEDLADELDEWSPDDAPARVDAYCSMLDATLLEAAASLQRLTAPVVLRVRTAAVRERVLRALPGSGGRVALPVSQQRSVVVTEGDILGMPVDAVVNASNRMLRLGAGVSGAIARAARPSLQAELTRLAGAGVAPGRAVLTSPHGIDGLRGIIHVNAVSGDRGDVRASVSAALEAAEQAGFRSVAVPLLGTGTGGLAVDEGIAVLAEVCAGWASSDAGALREVWVVLWSDAVFEAARDALQRAVARA